MLRSRFLSLISIMVLIINTMPLSALANPQGGNVAAGQATITETGSKLDIHQHTDRVVIDWRSFDIAPDEHTQFHQPSNSSIALNRVNSNSASNIYGKLTANGNVVIINQNGVLFGGGAQVDVNGLVASTADTDNASFMTESRINLNKPGNPTAVIKNEGIITAKQAGLVGFVAPNVANSGVIVANLGRVQLASGDTAMLDMYGDGLMHVAVSDDVKAQFVSNTGTIEANGGKIALTAAAGKNIVNSIITSKGSLKAQSVGVRNGEIIISANGKKTGSAKVVVDGKIDVSGLNGNEQGGKVTITADDIELKSNTHINASGNAGGGELLVGGDAHGKGTTQTALTNKVNNGAKLEANSKISGNGGKVIVWADKTTHYDGLIEAKAEGQTGKGGFVETSGKETLVIGHNAKVLASALNGEFGEWLLDPYDITIGASDDGNSGTNGSDPTATSTISHTTIEDALNNGTSVTITTGSTGSAGNDTGNITVSSAINTNIATGTPTLTLSAFRSILVNAGITADSGGNALNIILNSDNGGNQNGYIKVSAGIDSNNGSITMGGGNSGITAGSGFAWGNTDQGSGIFIDNATVNAGNGILIANGHAWNDPASSSTAGVLVSGTSAKLQTTGGNIYVYGTGGNGSASNYGVATNTSGVITSTDGDIYVEGRAGSSSGNSSHGVYVNTTAAGIKATGTGDVMVKGYAGKSRAASSAVHLLSGQITVVSGTLDVEGYGDVAGNASINTGSNGIYLSGATIASTGVKNSTCGATCGKVTVTGSGPDAYSNNYGVYLAGNNSVISTVDADLEVLGTSGNVVAGDNAGVRFNAGSAAIRSTGTGNVKVEGTGGNGTINNYGINLTRGSISSASGTLTIIGTAGNGSSTGNYGILLSNMTAFIRSTGGAIDITATGKNGAADIHNDNTAATLGGASSGDMTINADTMNWGSIVLNMPGKLSLKTRTSGADLILPAISTGVNSFYAQTTGGGDITLTGNITTSGSGNSIVLNSSGNFLNNSNFTLSPGTGRWVIYSTDADDDVAGGLSADQTIEGRTHGNLAPAAITTPNYNGSQNTWVYSSGGAIIRLTADAVTRIYGNANPTFTYSFWCSSGCAQADAITGNPILSTLATQASGIGDYAISISQGALSLQAAFAAYTLEFVDNIMTIDPRVITASLQGVVSKIYDRSTTATLTGANYLLDDIYNNDDVVLNNPSSGTYDNRNVGTGKTVSVTGLSLSGTKASNYVLDSTSISGAVGTVTAKELTISGITADNKTYDRSTTATLTGGSLSGIEIGDTVTLGSSYTANFNNMNAGNNKAVTVSGYNISGTDHANYTIVQPVGLTANIAQKNLAIEAAAKNVIYGNNTALTYSQTGLISGDNITGSLARAVGNDVGVYAINQGTLSAGSNYNISYTGANYTITPASLTVTANNLSKILDAADPALTYSVSGYANGDTSANFTGTLQRASGETLGNYIISRNTLDVGGNYIIGTFNNGIFTIMKAGSTDVTLPASVEYASQIPLPDISYQTDTITAPGNTVIIQPLEFKTNDKTENSKEESRETDEAEYAQTQNKSDDDDLPLITFHPSLTKYLNTSQ